MTDACANIPPRVKFFSFGGGVQSVACLVLAATGRIDFDTFVFSNVGDDSEDPATLEYIRDHARPYAEANGLTLHEIHRTRRDGTTETLYGRLTKEGSRSLPIPVRMSNGAPGTRSCTMDFKIRVIGKWAKQQGASEKNPATVGVGISVDEIERANRRRSMPYEQIQYPLLDLRMRRTDCHNVIRAAGLPVPPKSACWFCPFHRERVWVEMRNNRPELFERACQLEELLNERRAMLGKDNIYMTDRAMPLRRVAPEGVDLLPLFDESDAGGGCDGGWCNT